MSPHSPDSEDALETATIALFDELGYTHANLYHETYGNQASHGRPSSSDVIFEPRLTAALERLNPDLPAEAVALAVEDLSRDRSALNPVNANREVHDLLKNGVQVAWRNDEHEEVRERLRVIDWENPANNDFFLAQQLWVSGELYNRRCDLVACVNGVPLVFIELKKPSVNVKHAYDENLRDYQSGTIPQLWWYNAFIILSNGSDSRLGSMTAQWEHFVEWKKISSEGEKGRISLETMIRGTCEPSRLLALVENFMLFTEARGGLAKIVAKNHQFLGVLAAVEKVKTLYFAHNTLDGHRRLGVFWHTQGSGKSYSMVFFCQYVMRKIPGNWTFLIVTDRTELDKQIYKTFADCGLILEKQCQAESGSQLRSLLTEDHQFVFSLIQKFQTHDGSSYPKLSDRSDIIVITDEAHRSQYDTLAMNMRRALPNAAFLGFTGTPLMAGEERTREVFGDYVSVYNFKQSVDDGATVPLYYENRIPELQLTNENLNDDIERLLEDAELDDAQEAKLERTFAREYHLVTRDERLETISRDLVEHFLGRGHRGKAMMVAIDRFTAVRMYDKVKNHWQARLDALNARHDAGEHNLADEIAYMAATDMAVIISGNQNEQGDFAAKGLDIVTHRRRMVKEDLETVFKAPDSELRIVFVCAMWLTGFDVPACSTIYLDKPMKNHTLMQTIARANRVFPEKNNGLIVDYVGIFRNLQKALAIYGSAAGGGVGDGDTPVEDKQELVTMLRAVADETIAWCLERGVDVAAITENRGYDRIAAIDNAVETLLYPEEDRRAFISKANLVVRIHKAVMPDPVAHTFDAVRAVMTAIADKLKPDPADVDISKIMNAIETLLDASIATDGYVIREQDDGGLEEESVPYRVDLAQINFEALKAHFDKGRKRTVLEKFKTAIANRLHCMVERNKTRLDFMERFQAMIDAYNEGSKNIDEFFRELQAFVKELSDEDRRHIREGLDEEELTVFDILTKPEMALTETERSAVKAVARELLQRLKQEKLVLDWRRKQRTRADVKLTIETVLDRLPRTYAPTVWQAKCDAVYQHVFDAYQDADHSIYAKAG